MTTILISIPHCSVFHGHDGDSLLAPAVSLVEGDDILGSLLELGGSQKLVGDIGDTAVFERLASDLFIAVLVEIRLLYFDGSFVQRLGYMLHQIFDEIDGFRGTCDIFIKIT